MAEITDTISEVETRTLPTGKVIYALKFANGTEVTTDDRDIAKEAHGLVGNHGVAHAEYTEKKGGQFGQFTNRYLNSFTVIAEQQALEKVGDGFKLPDAPITTIAGPDPFADTEPEAANVVVTGVIGRDREAEKNLSIDKAVALKAAVRLMEFFEPEQRTAANVTGAAEYFLAWLQDYRP